MALSMTKKDIQFKEIVFDDFEEKSFDSDVVLPDYCPDIAVILKCKAIPYISSHMQSGDRYTADGATVLRVLYLGDDRKSVYSYETTLPFHVAFRANNATQHTVEAKCDYVNCRATGPRRLDIHGAVRVFLKAYATASFATVSENSQHTVCCRTQSVTSTVPVCEAVKSFSVADTIDLGIKVQRMIYADVDVFSYEQKVLTNKLIIKGMLHLKMVYGMEETVCCLHKEIPFSQILDIEGLNGDWQVDTRLCVSEREHHLHQSETENSALSVSCKLLANVHCCRNSVSNVVLDAYSTKQPLVCETAPLTFVHEWSSKIQNDSIVETIELPEGVCDLIDVWSEVKSCQRLEKDDERAWDICFLVGMIGCDDTGHLGYYERMLDYRYISEEYSDEPHIYVAATSGNANVNCLKLQIEIMNCCKACTVNTIQAVTNVYEESSEPFQNSGASIRIVYAHVGDTLWEIAKKHHSSVKDIQIENDISEETIQTPTMLMIPMN